MSVTVRMFPHLDDIQPLPTNGISQVVKQYFTYLPKYDIELVPVGTDDGIDILAVHAGSTRTLPNTIPVVAHNHGLYWTADNPKMGIWTDEMNQVVIDTVRHAVAVTVPSRWVAKVFERDMHFSPEVLPHGVNPDEWQGPQDIQGYVLWNKNRATDACDPTPVNILATRAPKTLFLTTYAAPNPRPNIRQSGTVDFETMKKMILNCAVYLATTKETFGIGTLEAMAAGKPILGFNHGGTADLVRHGYNGYLAQPGNYDDLQQGLEYCMTHAQALGENSRKAVFHYSWDSVAQRLAALYKGVAYSDIMRDEKVAVIIPLYNKASTVLRAIRSAIAQTHKPSAIYVINNNSSDDFAPQIDQGFHEAEAAGIPLVFKNCAAQGVAHARNLGIEMAVEEFIVCLDADDEMLPEFIEKCHRELHWDRSLGIVYTGMEVVNQAGEITRSQWPMQYNFDAVLRGRNQVPTCCLFRREAWKRAGGYRQRYAPNGAGSEDADLWLRIGLLGYGGKQAVPYPLFRYYLGGLVSGNPDYHEVDWRGDKGWLATGKYPFAATFTPINQFAHAVRQYDEPEISIVIPVSANHIDLVIDAIDSIEGQTFRKWELILVADGHSRDDDIKFQRYAESFPFIKFQNTYPGYQGAGAARNLGAELAKAPLLLFLDADDWLVPTALAEMMEAYREHPNTIIYSDYYGHAYIDSEHMLNRLRSAQRLMDYNQKTKEAKVLYMASEFDCQMAQAQPIADRDPYIWNVVSSLMPRAFHEEVGGFDVEMESWEDWDYWVRLAKAGKCFTHYPKPLLEYRFYTGQRRSLANPGESGESGRQLSSHLLNYMRNKYEEIENMPCSGCRGHRTNTAPPPAFMPASLNEGRMAGMSSTDLVMVKLIDGNIGDHLIAVGGTSYGYKVDGDEFMMQKQHAMVDRRVKVLGDSVLVNNAQPAPPPPPPAQAAPRPAPQVAAKPAPQIAPDAAALKRQILEELDDEEETQEQPEPLLPNPGPKPYDFVKLWGVDEARKNILLSAGVRTLDGLIMLGAARIAVMFDVNDVTAKRIVSEAEKRKEADAKKHRPAAKK